MQYTYDYSLLFSTFLCIQLAIINVITSAIVWLLLKGDQRS